MQAIRPYLDPNNLVTNPLWLTMPSQSAVLTNQSIDWSPGSAIVATQTWREPNGDEINLELTMDTDMKAGLVTACQVNQPINTLGLMGASGYLRMPSVQSGSGSYAGVSPSGILVQPRIKTKMEEKKRVKGMDYEFTKTGIMKHRKNRTTWT